MSANLTRILDAATVAALYHDGQRYGAWPYIVHPIEVAHYVAETGGTTEQVIAALLHDTVEDTALTIPEVSDRFGERVAELVASLTHDPAVPYPDYIAALHPGAVIVKHADSCHNLASLDKADMKPARRERLTARYEENIRLLRYRLSHEPQLSEPRP